MNLLRKLKSLGFVAIAVIFLFSAAISACGDGKKENAEDTEMESDSTTHMNNMDDMNHEAGEQHEMNTEEGEEHPTNHEGGEEHPTNEEGTEEHPTN